MMEVLHNHLGFGRLQPKRLLVRCTQLPPGRNCALRGLHSQALAWRGRLVAKGAVDGWGGGAYWEADFSALTVNGTYQLLVDGQPVPGARLIDIRDQVLDHGVLSDLVHYFKSQRCTGVFDAADRSCPEIGSAARHDVHGGWYDASGDASKYLSHLSYANFLNPQQTPLLAWALLDGAARLHEPSFWLAERCLDEALHGADFLVRMQDPAGFFRTTVFDQWSKQVERRQICSYQTQAGHLYSRFCAGWRQGGGMAIAALARASGAARDGEFTRTRYGEAAARGFAHLLVHNDQYLDDGQQNLIDDACALLAACELFQATGNRNYAHDASMRVHRIAAKQHEQGWFWIDAACTRSFYHASDAGLPLVALRRFVALAGTGESADLARQTAASYLAWELRATHGGAPNPFGYPRQMVTPANGSPSLAFFMPHDNESGYWWQGENARLASLVCSALDWTDQAPPELSQRLLAHAGNMLDWIFGRNPFDTCMMQGRGHRNPAYEQGCWNAPGGVCNGITSGLEDERGIDFRLPKDTTPAHSWRWTEQWLPHGAWLFGAVARMLAWQHTTPSAMS